MENKEVVSHLNRIAKEKNIKILFAVETGSRIWRLDSKDSDYDIRFVYIREAKDYLRINHLADQIDFMVEDGDFVGFDIYKFTKLILSSNPNMVEWLESDIIYINDGKTKKIFKEFIESRFNPIALYHHYKSMCKQNYLKYLKCNENMSYKKYLYAMRGLVNARWVAENGSIPPIRFEDCFEKVALGKHVKEKLRYIIKVKKNGEEKDKIEKIIDFDNEIERFLKEDEQVASKKIIDYSIIQDYHFELLGITDKLGKKYPKRH